MLTLMYHNILRESVGRIPIASGQVLLKDFRRQIKLLRKWIVHPVEAHAKLSKGEEPAGVLITFDDGAAGLRDAAECMMEFGVAGVAFVCPGAIEDGLWFYKLAEALVRSRRERFTWQGADFRLWVEEELQSCYTAISRELAKIPGEARQEALKEVVEELSPCRKEQPGLKILDGDGLRKTAETGAVYFANHTWSHPELTAMGAAEAKREIFDAQLWLNESGLPVVPWFAFPRGNFNGEVAEIARAAGLISFGANRWEEGAGIKPRTGIYRKDGNLLRFGTKLGLGILRSERKGQVPQTGPDVLRSPATIHI